MNATPVQPFAPRHVTTDLGDSLRITLPSRKRWFTTIASALFASVWLLVTLPIVGFGGAAMLNVMLNELRTIPAALAGDAIFFVFGLIWLSIWSIAGLTAGYAALWGLAGREVIEVSPLAIRLARRVPGWGRAQQYQAEHIQDLRVSPQAMPDWWMRRSVWSSTTPGQIAFDYGARTIRFGDCDEAEAKQILAEIEQRFPQYRPRPLDR